MIIMTFPFVQTGAQSAYVGEWWEREHRLAGEGGQEMPESHGVVELTGRGEHCVLPTSSRGDLKTSPSHPFFRACDLMSN